MSKWRGTGRHKLLKLQAVRFAAVGVFSNALLLLLYFAVTQVGVGHKTAVTGLYILAISQTYLMNRFWTFRHRGSHGTAFWRYLLVYGTVYVMNLLVMYVAVDRVGMRHEFVQFAYFLIMSLGMFLMQRSWVFKVSDAESGSTEHT